MRGRRPDPKPGDTWRSDSGKLWRIVGRSPSPQRPGALLWDLERVGANHHATAPARSSQATRKSITHAALMAGYTCESGGVN
jgi:hypothetical protein